MPIRICATYSFEAAHHLPNLPDGHKCKRMHGHNYKVDVSVVGEIDTRGFVLDYAELDAIVQPLIDKLDHRLLNDIDGLVNPTSEILCVWLKKKIFNQLPLLLGPQLTVRIWETPRYWVEV
jgi:6-pyruvoyltetrahydropterin/6-carboxytetrahydropterin synthase